VKIYGLGTKWRPIENNMVLSKHLKAKKVILHTIFLGGAVRAAVPRSDEVWEAPFIPLTY